MSAIVTNAASSKCLVVTRSLGKRDIDVTTLGYNRFCPTFYSKYSNNYLMVPSPKNFPAEYIKQLVKVVNSGKIDVLMPVNSVDTLLISKFKYKFTPYIKVPFSDYDQMLQLHDKVQLSKIAGDLGLPVPISYEISSMDELKNVASSAEYPLVIKLRNTTSSVGISYAHTPEEFVFNFKETIEKFNLTPNQYPLVQEYIPGDGYGVSSLYNQGDLRAFFVHKRLREYPVTGGPSTLRTSVRHSKMEKISRELLEHMGWHGLAMVEFKLDSRTNKPYLIEVNPRFWGSINQAVSSGVDFPNLLYDMAVEGDVQPVFKYKEGVKTRSLFNDLRSFPGYFRKSKSRTELIKDFIKFKEHDLYYDVLSTEDVLPSLFFSCRGLLNRF
ncbi:ATP-grasp domain-containing protein [Methanolobus sp. ZRKC5]|uniref:carboxylate--amine ligase n=1 Tax=unclassified Methanolobus TaxID=2629569 RepID=UPI00313B166F